MQQGLLHRVGAGPAVPGPRERVGDRACALGTGGGSRDGVAQRLAPVRRSSLRRGNRTPAPAVLDAAGDLELVAPEGHRAHRDAVGQGLLGDPHAAVGHRTHRARQHRAVRQEPVDVGVGRYRETGRRPGREWWPRRAPVRRPAPPGRRSISRPSSWNSDDVVTSTMGRSTSASHAAAPPGAPTSTVRSVGPRPASRSAGTRTARRSSTAAAGVEAARSVTPARAASPSRARTALTCGRMTRSKPPMTTGPSTRSRSRPAGRRPARTRDRTAARRPTAGAAGTSTSAPMHGRPARPPRRRPSS